MVLGPCSLALALVLSGPRLEVHPVLAPRLTLVLYLDLDPSREQAYAAAEGGEGASQAWASSEL